jgi:hypothetical protein
MTKEERAAQIWPILTLCALRRQTLSYDQLGRLIGVPRQGLGQLLEPIQSLCILYNMPPLTALVVSDVDGLPGSGFIAAQDVPKAQAFVFSFDWMKSAPPDRMALGEAAQKLPSNGRPLDELRANLRV